MLRKMLLFTCLVLILNPIVSKSKQGLGAESVRERTRIGKAIENLNIPFIENVGQFDDRVRFCAETYAGVVFVTEQGDIVYSLVALMCLAWRSLARRPTS